MLRPLDRLYASPQRYGHCHTSELARPGLRLRLGRTAEEGHDDEAEKNEEGEQSRGEEGGGCSSEADGRLEEAEVEETRWGTAMAAADMAEAAMDHAQKGTGVTNGTLSDRRR